LVNKNFDWHGGVQSENDFNFLKIRRARFDSGVTTPKQGLVLMACYHVAFLCAKKRKPHTAGEERVKPYALR